MKLLLSCLIKNKVNDDTENESASNSGDGYLANSHCHTADTGDKDDRSGEEVCVLLKVDLLDHLETRNCDEAVKSDTYAAHYASGNRIKECNEGGDEGNDHRHHSGYGDGDDRCVSCDSNTADGFAVCGVGTAAENGTYQRTYAVTEKRSVKTGLFKKVGFDDGRKVLVVCNVLRKYYESNGNVSNDNGCKEGEVEFTRALKRGEEGEFGNCNECGKANTFSNESLEGSKINDLERGILGCDTDKGEYKTYCVAGKDTDDEGNELDHLLTVGRANDNDKKGYDSADEGYPNVCGHNECAVAVLRTVREYVFNSRAREGKTDEGNRGADNNGGHKSVDPLNTRKFYYDSYDYVNKCRSSRTDQKTEEAELH